MGCIFTKNNPLICKIGGKPIRYRRYQMISTFQDALRIAGVYNCGYEDMLVLVSKHEQKKVYAYEKFYLVDKILFGEIVVNIERMYGKRAASRC